MPPVKCACRFEPLQSDAVTTAGTESVATTLMDAEPSPVATTLQVRDPQPSVAFPAVRVNAIVIPPAGERLESSALTVKERGILAGTVPAGAVISVSASPVPAS